MSQTVILKSQRVVFADRVEAAALVIEDGLIKAVEPYDIPNSTYDYENLAIMPGVIDHHVHFNEPGRTEWEGWHSGTLAAISGGVTTVVEMPLNSIPSTVDPHSFRVKVASMQDKLHCDVGLWGGAVPGNVHHLKALIDEGALGLKCFLSDPGTEEFANLDENGLREAMQEISRIGSVLLIHAEWPEQLLPPHPSTDPFSYAAWLETRPVEAEKEAIRRVQEMAKQTGCRCHIMHVSSAEALGDDTLTYETCAHYLVFCAEEIEARATRFKCAPPIREKRHQDSLWEALKEGRISAVSSDHSPCSPALKSDNFLTSWGGISGVQMLLPAVWTGASQRGYELTDLARWLAHGPAEITGLNHLMGRIEVGLRANLAVFDPEAEFVCQGLAHRHPGSAYEGRTWKGVVEATYLRGVRVYSRDQTTLCQGRLLKR